ncbi:MAG TPA: amidohydrolase family protein [Longimicrobiales bacterium]|nr:amidohydrolase family protein [Longimicrobiales bacterium]
MRRRLYAVLISILLLPGALAAQERPQVFRGARVIPIGGPVIENGTLVVHQGKIVAVGVVGSVREPANAVVHDVAGKVIMPGLVDTHSHIGGGDGGDASAALHGDVRILDALDVRDPGIQKAQAGGITTVNIMPGSGLLMSGQTAYVKLRDGRTIYDLLYCRDVLREVCGGMKMANGTNPRGTQPRPGTRAKAAALARVKFVKAQEYRDKVRAAGRDASKLPARDIELEALAEVLDGRRTVHFHSHRHDDILTAIRLKQEFGFKLVLQHATEAWRVAREIAAAQVPVSVIVIDAPGGKLEAMGLSFETGAVLEKAGVLVGFHTDDGITDSRFFLRSAALAVRAGMSRAGALAAMTINNARMLELDNRVGSLAAGKDADFIVLSGDPFSIYTHVEQTWVEGNKVFDLSNAEDREFAVGAYGINRGVSAAHMEIH